MNDAAKSGRFSLAEIQRAEDAARRVQRALETPSSLDHSLSLLIVLAKSLQQASAQFSVDWIDKPVNQLQAMHNLSTSLARAASEARDQLTLALGTVLEYRAEHTGQPSVADAEITALCQTITKALREMANETTAVPRPGDDSTALAHTPRDLAAEVGEALAAAEIDSKVNHEPVVANRRTGVYHAAGCNAIERIVSLDRIAFVNAEAAKMSGFHPSPCA